MPEKGHQPRHAPIPVLSVNSSLAPHTAFLLLYDNIYKANGQASRLHLLYLFRRAMARVMETKKTDIGVRAAKIVQIVDEGGNGKYITVTYEFRSKKQAREVIKQYLIEGSTTEFCLDLERA